MSIIPDSSEVVLLGLANMDALAYIDEDFLNRCGARKGTTVAISGRLLSRIAEQLEDVSYIPGGSAANTAASLASHGHKVSFIGKVGDDAHGQSFRDAFKSTGVHFDTPPEAGKDTSLCLVLVTPDKEQSFLYCADAAAWQLEEQDLPDFSAHCPRIVYAEAYLATIQDKSGVNLLSMLESALPDENNELVINIVDSAYLSAYKSHIFEILRARHCTLIGNHFEFLSLFGTDENAGLQSQAIDMDCDFIITRGAHGLSFISKDECFDLKAPDIDFDTIIDTVGAGDYCAAGFMHGLLQNHDKRRCCELGIEFATESLKIPGARAVKAG
ncbi:MAG: adenosine kinase [Rhodospirillales bacterium]|nr:adenosine kinase [Rhodospirillales bacterium]